MPPPPGSQGKHRIFASWGNECIANIRGDRWWDGPCREAARIRHRRGRGSDAWTELRIGFVGKEARKRNKGNEGSVPRMRLAIRVATRRGMRKGRRSTWHGSARSFRTTTTKMSLQTGIVGMPNVGKSTLFNAMVQNAKAEAANFPFCTIEPNTGVVTLRDERLQALSTMSKSKQVVPTTIEFVDIAGLVQGASKGEGLGNQFLSHIREVDSIVQVLRCFEDENVVHVDGRVDPVSDSETINLELALADLSQIEKRLARLKKGSKVKADKAKEEDEAAVLQRIQVALEAGQGARTVPLSPEEYPLVKGLSLLTMKPMIYAANVSEDDLPTRGEGNVHVEAVRKLAEEQKTEVVIVSAQVESELVDLDEDERKEFLESIGVQEGGLNSLVRATYKQLGLLTYFTTGEQETRAWTIRRGMTAPQAAGVIHTDFEKGFIRAETVAYDALVGSGSMVTAKEKGLVRLEGKEYVVQEGDVMLFRFNV